MKTLIALVAVILVGLTSTTFSTDPFGRRAYQPSAELTANALVRSQTVRRTTSPAVQLFAELQMSPMEAMSRPE